MTLAKSIMRIALATASLLLIPLVAMQFTREVAWSLDDFIVAGILLFGTGFTYAVIARAGNNTAYRVAVGIAVVAGLLLVWGNLAVGFIGSENNPTNLLYGAVLAVAIIGAIGARLRPLGMAKTMFTTAATQFLVPLVAALIWRPELDLGMMQVLVLNAVFALLWVGSGLLFRRANTPSSILDAQRM